MESKKVYVKCGGSAAGKERFAGLKTCEEALALGFKKGECQWGCTGNGSCIAACKEGAMSMVDGKVVIDNDKCNGCGDCISACPQHLIHEIPEDATNIIPCSSLDDAFETRATCNYGCVGCGDCEIACPKGAITMEVGQRIDERFAKIDYSKCEGCVSCTVACRKKIIVDSEPSHDLTKLKNKVAFVKCAGGSWGHAILAETEYTSCKDIMKARIDLTEKNVCNYSCLGMGDCVKVCRYGAISNEYGVAKVDPDKCVGCQDCYFECPRHKIEMVPYLGVKLLACESEDDPERRMEICGMGCIGCGDCAENCPNDAISMVDGHPIVDHRKCLNCHVCMYVCSRGLIYETIVPESNYYQVKAMRIDE